MSAGQSRTGRLWAALFFFLAAVLTATTAAGDAAAAVGSTAETRVKAVQPVSTLLVGPTADIAAGQHPDRAPPQHDLAQGRGVHTYYVLPQGTDGSTGSAVLVHNTSGCDPVRLKAGQQAPGGLALSQAEKRFVSDLLGRKPNLQVFRTSPGAGEGDFLVIDRSNPRSLVGWVVELKSSSGGFAGGQLKNAGALARRQGLDDFRAISGTPAEMIRKMSVGRGSW